MDEQQAPLQDAQRRGSWWQFVALLLGAPPIAVWGGEEEVEQERQEHLKAEK